MNWIWAIPPALVAIITLVTVAPVTHRRRCAARAEQLAKLVDAAGDRCPKAMRAELIERINWVAAYRAVRYTTKHRAFVWAGWSLSVTTAAMFIGVVAVVGPSLAVPTAKWISVTCSVAALTVFEFFPAAVVMDWMYARRLLYVKLGGRDDFTDLKFPGLRHRGYTSGAVKRLLLEVFGDRDLTASTLKSGDILAFRRAMGEWEAIPMPWPSRRTQNSDGSPLPS